MNGLHAILGRERLRDRLYWALREGARPLIVACGIVTGVLGLIAVAS